MISHSARQCILFLYSVTVTNIQCCLVFYLSCFCLIIDIVRLLLEFESKSLHSNFFIVAYFRPSAEVLSYEFGLVIFIFYVVSLVGDLRLLTDAFL